MERLVWLVAGLVTITSMATLYAWDAMTKGYICLWTFPIPLLIPSFFGLGVMAGYYLARIVESREVLSKIRASLRDDERQVLDLLVKNNGRCFQSTISKVLGKVQASRAIQRLEKKGIVERVKVGKTYLILLKV